MSDFDYTQYGSDTLSEIGKDCIIEEMGRASQILALAERIDQEDPDNDEAWTFEDKQALENLIHAHATSLRHIDRVEACNEVLRKENAELRHDQTRTDIQMLENEVARLEREVANKAHYIGILKADIAKLEAQNAQLCSETTDLARGN